MCLSADLDNHHPQAVLGLLAQHATLNSVPHCHFMLKQDSPAHRWYCVLEIFARRFLQQKEATDDLLAYLTAAACVARLCTTEHSHEDQPGTGPFCLQVEQRGSSVNHLPWHIQCHWGKQLTCTCVCQPMCVVGVYGANAGVFLHAKPSCNSGLSFVDVVCEQCKCKEDSSDVYIHTHITLGRVMSCHVMSCHVMSCHTTLYYDMSHHIFICVLQATVFDCVRAKYGTCMAPHHFAHFNHVSN